MIFLNGFRRIREWVVVSSSRQLFAIGAISVALLIGNLAKDVHAMLEGFDWKRVEKRTLHCAVSTAGVVEAGTVILIKSEVAEALDHRNVNEGDSVKKGDVLLVLTQSRTLMEFQQKKNALDEAEGAYDRAVREHDLQLKLFNADAASGLQLEDSERAQARALTALDVARQDFRLVRERLRSTSVRSPIDGIVLKDYTLAMSEISLGKELVVVADTSTFAVRANVDELELPQLKVGQSVEIRVDAFPGKAMVGVLESIAAQAERDTFAKIPVRIKIIDMNQLPLKHNLSVRVSIVSEDIPDAMGIPLKAILGKEGTRAYVYVRNRFNIVNKHLVQLGKVAGEEVQVISGLEEGDLVGVPVSGHSL